MREKNHTINIVQPIFLYGWAQKHVSNSLKYQLSYLDLSNEENMAQLFL